MAEDFDEVGSWPGRGDWHGRAEHTRPARRHHRSAGSMCAVFALSERCHAPIYVTGA